MRRKLRSRFFRSEGRVRAGLKPGTAVRRADHTTTLPSKQNIESLKFCEVIYEIIHICTAVVDESEE